MSIRNFAKRYWPGLMLFACSAIIALFIVKDYGISWDEPLQQEMGQVSYSYVFNHDKYLLIYGDRSHGVAFELPLIFAEKMLHLTDSRKIYFMRHLATHLFFLFSVFCGYVLVFRLFKDQFLAVMGFMLLAFNPRIYAHSFFNTKDIPFLSALIIVFAVSQIAFEKNKTWWYVLLGVVAAYATSIRAMGVLMVPVIGLFFLADMVAAYKDRNALWRVVKNALLFAGVFCGFLYATWPLLWSAPIHFFKEEFTALSHILWRGFVLLDGVNYPGDKLPWFYVPLWFSITIPILWLVLGVTGLMVFIVWAVTKPKNYLQNRPERNYVMYFVCLVVPVAAVIMLHSVNYDDWRHLYFIYPAFVMFVLFALWKLAAGKRRMIVIAACVVQMGFTGGFMVSAHPFQQVYFNALVSHKDEFLRKNYDLEYWGCADKQALEYIAAHDTAANIKIWLSLNPVANNLMIVPDSVRNRIQLVDTPLHPDYFITNFRNHPDDYNYPSVFYEIKVQNSTILRVYKMH